MYIYIYKCIYYTIFSLIHLASGASSFELVHYIALSFPAFSYKLFVGAGAGTFVGKNCPPEFSGGAAMPDGASRSSGLRVLGLIGVRPVLI